MRHNLILYYYFLIIYITSFSGRAESLTSQQFQELLIKTHPVFQKEALGIAIEKEDQLQTIGAMDWVIASSFGVRHEQPALSFAGPNRMTSLIADIGLEKTFWSTGGKVAAGYRTGYYDLKLDPFYGIPSSLMWNQFQVTYTHPLIRNRAGFLDRLRFNLEQFDIDYSEVIAEERCEDFLAGAALKYLEWALVDKQLEIAGERLSLSREELARTRRFYEAKLIDRVDIIRAQDAVLTADQRVVQLESMWKALQAELAELAGDSLIYRTRPDFDLFQKGVMESRESAIQRLKKESRLVQPLLIRIRQLEYYGRGLEEEIRPDLSAYTTFLLERIDENKLRVFGLNKPTAEVGVKLSFSLEKRTIEHRIEKNDLQVQQLKTSIDEIGRHLSALLSNLYAQLETMEDVLHLNREQIESAVQKTQEELKLYERGRGELTFVLQSRDDEQTARLMLTQNAFHYQNLLVQYRALMDELYRKE